MYGPACDLRRGHQMRVVNARLDKARVNCANCTMIPRGSCLGIVVAATVFVVRVVGRRAECGIGQAFYSVLMGDGTASAH